MTSDHESNRETAAPKAEGQLDGTLRRLATRAFGMTGADVERIVREARQTARRQRRSMTLDDVEAGIRGERPPRPYNARWRFAVHEAGHAVVHHSLELGDIISLTIDHHDGGHNNLAFRSGAEDTESWYNSVIAMLLAGRAAESLIIGSVTSGSGGLPESDLARATNLALSTETTLGLSSETPLLYRDYKDATLAISYDPRLAARVNTRLEAGYALATETLEANRPAFTHLCKRLFDEQVMDGMIATAILQESQ